MDSEKNFYRLSKEELRAQRPMNLGLTLACFLGEQLTLEIPQYQFDIWKDFCVQREQFQTTKIGESRKATTVPREHNKTTLVKAFIPDSLRCYDFDFLLYASATFTSAANAIRDIVEWFLLESEQALWGPTVEVKRNESEGLWILRIPTSTGANKTIILKAIGSNTRVRGLNVLNRRPNLIVFDDIEDKETADVSSTGKGGKNQLSLDEWFWGTAMKVSANRSLKLFIGNIIRDTTILARIVKEPTWNPTNYGCLVRNRTTGKLEPLWPALHTVESLLNEYRAYRKMGQGSTWESEMMNLSRDLTFAESLPESCLIPDVNPEELEVGFIVIDPAFGDQASNDDTAFTVHGRKRGLSTPFVCDYVVGKMSETQMFDTMLELIYKWGLTTVAIEAIAGARLYIPLFRAFMLEREIPRESITFVPFAGQRTKDAKSTRIAAFRRSLQDASYYLCESLVDLKLTLEEWSHENSAHDDGPDSAALGQVVWEKEGQLVELAGGYQARIGELLHGQELGEIMHGRSELMTASI